MLHEPSAFHVIAQALLDEIVGRLNDAGGETPDRVCVVPGAIAWDDCDCGLLAAAVTRVFLSTNFPTPDLGQQSLGGGCDSPYRVGDIALQLIRCAPQPQGLDLNVPCDVLAASALEVIEDAHHVMSGAACKLQEMLTADDIIDYEVQDQGFAGPAGACVGSELHVLVCLPRL